MNEPTQTPSDERTGGGDVGRSIRFHARSLSMSFGTRRDGLPRNRSSFDQLLQPSDLRRTPKVIEYDLPLNLHPKAIRASAGLVRYPTLDRRKVEFSGL